MTLSFEAAPSRPADFIRGNSAEAVTDAAVADMASCFSGLPLLLKHLGWPVTPRQVTEAMPITPGMEPTDDLRDVLGRLGFSAVVQASGHFSLKTLGRLHTTRRDRRLPLLYLPVRGAPLLVEPHGNHLTVLQPQESGGASRTERRDGLDAGMVVVLAPPSSVMGGRSSPGCAHVWRRACRWWWFPSC